MSAVRHEVVRVNPVLLHPAERRVSLDGTWRFRLDPDDVGVRERWFADAAALDAVVEAPGCWQGQGHGHDGPDRVWDFGFEERTLRATYTGTGWAARRFTVPDAWERDRVQVCFGGVHPSAEVWLNGEPLGSNDMPFAPFGFEVTGRVRFGAENTLAVRVHEAARLYGLAFSWQGNWSGLYRGVDLTATGACRIAWCALYPDAAAGQVRVHAALDGAPPPGTHLVAALTAPGGERGASVGIPVTGPVAEVALPAPSPHLWSPNTPSLYSVAVELVCGALVLDAVRERTGFVSLSAGNRQFRINGAPTYMRGTGDFVSCPETGSPDTNRDRWRRKMRALRDYGYNYVRCQSYVYGPEYYDAADEAGILVQSEMGILGAWGGTTPRHSYQWPKPTPDHYPVLARQWDLVVRRDVNHPSANLYCMSNEYGRETDFPRIAWRCYHDTRAVKPTALVIWTDGGFNPDLPGDFVNDEASRVAETDLPVIQHEYRWWSSLPDPALKSKYVGAVRPYAITMLEREAERAGIAALVPQFVRNSQRLQLMEAALRMEDCRRDHPQLAGICHFNAMDAGPSPQGVIDEFYETKLASPAEWLRSNGDTVVLCSLGPDARVIEPGAELQCDLFLSDFGSVPLRRAAAEWSLVVDGRVVASGAEPVRTRPYATRRVARVQAPVPAVERPTRAVLRARVRDAVRSTENAWNVWIVPPDALPAGTAVCGDPAHTWARTVPGDRVSAIPQPGAGQVLVAEDLDAGAVGFMQRGGAIVLAASEGMVRPHRPNFGTIRYFFTPPANYGPYEDGQNATVVARHPMLGEYPHDGWADLQFFRLIENAPPLDLGGLGLAASDPVIRVFHRYPVCHLLAYLGEWRVGAGRLVVCALDLDYALPEARYLLAAICAHAASGPLAADEMPPASLERIAVASRIGGGRRG